ncbi:MAG: hypothetical protein EHM12_00010 [Dehalococcoidia bacterium]|nr:MAG: hypothetical protein EHM12_00010 [Dehalococcoidia bacterium]
MVSPVSANKPSGGNIFSKLPRLSTSIWLLIIVALVLIVCVPMVTAYFDSSSQQAALQDRLSKLQTQYAGLQKELTPQGSLTAQVNQLRLDVEAAESIYGNACDSVETSRDLIDLAWQYDITITNISASAVITKIKGKDYAGTSYLITMSGQVSNFQNYLIALGNKFPTSQPTEVEIKPAKVQGTLDAATIKIFVVCNR